MKETNEKIVLASTYGKYTKELSRAIVSDIQTAGMILHNFMKGEPNAENKMLKLLVDAQPIPIVWAVEPKEGETGAPACGFCAGMVEFTHRFCPWCGRALDFGRTSSDAYDID